MQINKNFVQQVGDQPRLYYDARSISHQDLLTRCFGFLTGTRDFSHVRNVGPCNVSDIYIYIKLYVYVGVGQYFKFTP